MRKSTVLFLCIGNSIRSQMAEGFARQYGQNKIECLSAGISPGFVHPMAIRVMKEKGIDISDHTSKSITSIDLSKVTTLITLCGEAEEVCPTIPQKISKYHWPFPDPCRVLGSEEARLNSFRQVRDAIELKVKQFIEESLSD